MTPTNVQMDFMILCTSDLLNQSIIWDYHGDLFPLYCWLLNRLKMLDIMRQNWTTGQKFFDQVVMAGAMFAQYISRSKDQHRVFVHSGQSSQIHTGWDVIQALFLSSNIKSCNLSEHTWDLSRPAVMDFFSWCHNIFRKQRENICSSWVLCTFNSTSCTISVDLGTYCEKFTHLFCHSFLFKIECVKK